MNGVLVKYWEAHCYLCERGALGLNGHNPAQELREEGWVQRRRADARDTRVWICKPCAPARGVLV